MPPKALDVAEREGLVAVVLKEVEDRAREERRHEAGVPVKVKVRDERYAFPSSREAHQLGDPSRERGRKADALNVCAVVLGEQSEDPDLGLGRLLVLVHGATARREGSGFGCESVGTEEARAHMILTAYLRESCLRLAATTLPNVPCPSNRSITSARSRARASGAVSKAVASDEGEGLTIVSRAIAHSRTNLDDEVSVAVGVLDLPLTPSLTLRIVAARVRTRVCASRERGKKGETHVAVVALVLVVLALGA